MMIKGIEAFAREVEADTLPPVHEWNPPYCGDIGLEIRHDGKWWHEGRPINRYKIVKLFSRILRKDPDGIYLVTPFEKVNVRVETTPFIAIDVQCYAPGEPDQILVFETNLGEYVKAGGDNPIILEMDAGSPKVEVRAGLMARLSRACYYRTMQYVEEMQQRAGHYILRSDNAVFYVGAEK